MNLNGLAGYVDFISRVFLRIYNATAVMMVC
jgi:hypothetical protein